MESATASCCWLRAPDGEAVCPRSAISCRTADFDVIIGPRVVSDRNVACAVILIRHKTLTGGVARVCLLPWQLIALDTAVRECLTVYGGLCRIRGGFTYSERFFLSLFFLCFFFFFFFFLTAVLFHWGFCYENLGCIPLGKPAATESRYPTFSVCWVF